VIFTDSDLESEVVDVPCPAEDPVKLKRGKIKLGEGGHSIVPKTTSANAASASP